jgi:hypothetical protein
MAKVCITYLLFPELRRYSSNESSAQSLIASTKPLLLPPEEIHGFLNYSTTYWIAHTRETQLDADSWVEKMVKLCDIGDGSMCPWAIGNPVCKRSAFQISHETAR